MNASRHNLLMNSFHPAKEVDDPDFFAGRAAQVKQLADALHLIGSCPVIYGDRGLGKTSLAVQMKYIAMGDNELLESLNLTDRAFSKDQGYLTFFVTCTDATQDADGVLQMLINAAEEVDFTEIEQRGKAKRLAERTISHKFSLKAFEAENIKRYEREKSRASYQELNLPEKLITLIQILIASYNQPLLFIIDEVDRLGRTRGLASFIKAASNESVKFMLVGIASNISSLLADHQSLERSIISVRVPLMNEGELYEIVEKAENYLHESGIATSFDHFATLKLVELAAGFPWFVHVIGLHALLLAEEEGRDTVVESDVLTAVENITNNQFAQQFSDIYRNVVRDSYQREMVLRAFAEWRGPDIPTTEVYRLLKTKLAVSNPSVYKGHLSGREYGQILVTPEFRNRTWVRFANEMFKTYVRLRGSIFVDLDKKVTDACAGAYPHFPK